MAPSAPFIAGSCRLRQETRRTPNWPGKARIAVSSFSTTQEGAGRTVSCMVHIPLRAILSLKSSVPSRFPDRHHEQWNSYLYEYGLPAPRVWRILKEFSKHRGLPDVWVWGHCTWNGILDRGCGIQGAGARNACHGWRWLHYQDIAR